MTQNWFTNHRRLTSSILFIIVFLFFFSIPFLADVFSNKKSYGLPSTHQAPEFSLKNSKGETVSLSHFRGKLVFLMFGYLNCEKICHSQALIFQEINQLADMKDNLVFLYIAMDPARDSSSELEAYFDQRGENFISLRESDFSKTQKIAMEYRAYYSQEGSMKKKDYTISHPGLFFLIGPDGNFRYIYTANQKSSYLILEDLITLK